MHDPAHVHAPHAAALREPDDAQEVIDLARALPPRDQLRLVAEIVGIWPGMYGRTVDLGIADAAYDFMRSLGAESREAKHGGAVWREVMLMLGEKGHRVHVRASSDHRNAAEVDARRLAEEVSSGRKNRESLQIAADLGIEAARLALYLLDGDKTSGVLSP